MGIKKTIIENVKLSDLIPYDKNYQNHKNNLEYIKNSIKDFGYSKVSIGVDENNIIIYGHGTKEAMEALNETHAPFVMKIEGMNEKQKRALRIADNESSRSAEFIIENLRFEYEEIGIDIDLSKYGLDLSPELFNLDEKTETNLNKTFFLEIEFANNEEMDEVYKELLNRGYIVRVKNG